MKAGELIVAVVGSTALIGVACSSSHGRSEVREQAASAAQSGEESDALLECQNPFQPWPSDPPVRGEWVTTTPMGGSLTDDDGVQAGIFEHESHSRGCTVPAPVPPILPSMRPRFDVFAFKNRTSANCVSVYYETSAYRSGTGGARAAVYVGPFDPDDIAKNFVAVSSGILADMIHAIVPAGAEFSVVMFGEGTESRPGYSLFVGGCGMKDESGPPDGGDASSSSGGSGKTW
jgi:hypothetical protein